MKTASTATSTTTADLFDQFTTKAIEGVGLWAEANQKVLQRLVDFSTSAAAESVRVYAEIQSSAVQAFKGGQEFLLGQNGRLKDFQKDPFGTYQKGVLEGLGGAQQTFKLVEAGAESVTKSAERLQASAEHASKDIQATFAALGSRLKTLYTPAESKAS